MPKLNIKFNTQVVRTLEWKVLGRGRGLSFKGKGGKGSKIALTILFALFIWYRELFWHFVYTYSCISLKTSILLKACVNTVLSFRSSVANSLYKMSQVKSSNFRIENIPQTLYFSTVIFPTNPSACVIIAINVINGLHLTQTSNLGKIIRFLIRFGTSLNFCRLKVPLDNSLYILCVLMHACKLYTCGVFFREVLGSVREHECKSDRQRVLSW